MDLPKYQSHKVVEAFKIGAIESHGDGSARLAGSVPGLEETFVAHVSPEYIAKHTPDFEAALGGYWVRYADGYESWSPAKAFEEGYTRLNEAEPAAPAPGEDVRRWLEGHKVNPANEQLEIAVMDDPGPGGACHLYEIHGFDTETNPSDPYQVRYGGPALHTTILFQNGPIAEAGVNGVTHEALITILIDRLEHFQAGPYACAENAEALEGLRQAQSWLNRRTEKREARGVEGTHEV